MSDTRYAILVICDALGANIYNQWLVAFDHDCCDGSSDMMLSADPVDALMFESAEDCLKFYGQISTTVPLRPDGHPNRPLTSFTVQIGLVPANIVAQALERQKGRSA